MRIVEHEHQQELASINVDEAEAQYQLAEAVRERDQPQLARDFERASQPSLTQTFQRS